MTRSLEVLPVPTKHSAHTSPRRLESSIRKLGISWRSSRHGKGAFGALTQAAGLRDFYEERAHATSLESDRVRRTVGLVQSDLRPPPSRTKILDLGCGQGELAASIRSILPSAMVFGVEWSQSGCKSAQRRDVPVVQASVDGVNLPFSSASFDAVIIAEVIEHLVDTDQVLREVQRVLVPDGLLVLTTPNLAAWFNRILLLSGVQPVFSEVSLEGIYGRPGDEPVGHLRLFTRRALIELLSSHGFVDIRISGAMFHRTPRGIRWLDRLATRWPGGASILIARVRTPNTE
jgi:2-polyprenyl-3-methyl-5-hydroxy-6-metoxy-1,4-benzoquinol methylase